MNIKSFLKISTLSLVFIFIISACAQEKSRTTGWVYNDPNWGGFEVAPYEEQETGPGLVLVTGGTFVMGRTEQDVTYQWDNVPRRVSVSSFYMDMAEVANVDYREYIYWLSRVFGTDYPEVVNKALPDTLVWLSRLGYNDPFVEYYFRHPAYNFYPVVGVNWRQANDYASWRTDRVNEYILVREGILKLDNMQMNENNFNTDAYLAGQYEGIVKNELYDLNPTGMGTRKVRVEDGILLPKYRLPTEAEWEYAALGLIGNTVYERVLERRVYPWNGHVLRTDYHKNMGDFVANFVRGRGDYMGVAGYLNDGYDATAPVFSYWPNDFGLYNMAGNVAEWVLDVYRPLSYEDMDEWRPYRGNVFMTKVRDEEGLIAEKDSLGRIQWRPLTEEEAKNRYNFRYADNRDYLDGDYTSSIYYDQADYLEEDQRNKIMYEYGKTSLINNQARVYKGGSWKDRAYFLSPGTRRFLDEEMATDYIGFRCAMTRVGAPVNYGSKNR
ncbi:MAG: SUMF1/EgtB/PvdO family nonheme iron enzyme [Bacteroidales bacterium]|jgi:sulfatase modifying factor 1|nr:SUMF1/EgtB/PvdO family nonheme iron enzyme [Bacteroidales bacterium]MDI9576440.1 SUMF1/EgtB/PvdO family nonheme iron enzyme [Bacteroidota bacterium]MDD3755411.1 SUMF1/EgtB/PvdO family nonheme iron enzyme [Bacteroidales bacterium]MDY0400385.1 SUMF1/EgtB/PvdO family nonheme iron enzyme [Bacteroidales bacterium]HOB76878.1 SUMF1/EgtB/PvdO family nonheme iron enzyme [Bacteroidales bacterium]